MLGSPCFSRAEQQRVEPIFRSGASSHSEDLAEKANLPSRQDMRTHVMNNLWLASIESLTNGWHCEDLQR